MPRPRKAGGPEPKRRSRNGCWPCKHRKVKCGEEKPSCTNCERNGEKCDYSIRLNWDGRAKKKDAPGLGLSSFQASIKSPNATAEGPAIEQLPNSPGLSSFGYGLRGASNISGTPDSNFFQTLDEVSSDSNLPMFGIESTGVIDPELVRFEPPSISPPKAPQATQNVGLMGEGKIRFDQVLSHQRNNSDSRGNTGPIGYSSNFNPFHLPDQPSHYPSPSDSNVDDHSIGTTRHNPTSHLSGVLSQSVSPRQQSFQPRSQPYKPLEASGLNTSSEHRKKRARLSSDMAAENLPQQWAMPPPRSLSAQSMNQTSIIQQGPPLLLTPYSPYQSGVDTPITPAASSVGSDEHIQRSSPKYTTSTNLTSPNVRKLSVDSLLSSPIENTHQMRKFRGDWEETKIYGYDVGAIDADIPDNDDQKAIVQIMPTILVDDKLESVSYDSHKLDSSLQSEFGFGLRLKDHGFEKGGYYRQPVAIKIPTSLGALPPLLSENPMNLLYFHHFLNHTARILTPHDCSENPFKTVLPEMAFGDTNLLKLLLAYSASHRARLIGQKEPENRIAEWVKDVFPTLRLALSDERERMSNSNLATAIMLASLEIISPNAFAIPISWQQHLDVARQLVIAQGGAKAMRYRNKVSYFLYRWLAYLDVLGSLSGGHKGKSLFGETDLVEDDIEDENDFQIDCLLGFTSRSVGVLARIANVARQISQERIRSNGEINHNWRPSEETVKIAEKLKNDLQVARLHVYTPCSHRLSEDESEIGGDSLELVTTNEAFHWAGLIHIRRRVLGVVPEDPEVQDAVRHIIGGLCKIRRGGTAEVCLLFPMFTAGCDALQPEQRRVIMERLDTISLFGMTQVRKARELLQNVWDTGKEWETLVDGEFVG